ncbi:MAG: TonB-dependent receptor [candidate division KSB1 bacterium]|nr:TonB-dependent receptor [candidate division KSB1 bacterium]
MRDFAFLCAPLILVVFLSPATVAAPTAGVLSGRALDRTTERPVADVALRLDGIAIAMRTGADGKFSFSAVPPGVYTLSAHRLGYRAVTIAGVRVAPGTHTDLVLRLEPAPVELPPVYVTADRTMTDLEAHLGGIRVVIDPVQQSHLPGTFADPLRGLRNLPAFSMASDYNGLLYARGGSPDQNLVLLDHTAISYPYRLRLLMGGGISAFPAEILSYVEVMPGGFPARFGDRTSAVIQLHTREPSRERRSLACHVDMLAASSVIEQPLLRGAGSVLIAGRRSVIDLIGSAISKGPYAFPRFEDLFAKMSLTPLPGHKINVTLAGGNEKTTLATVESEEMGLSQDSRSRALMVDWTATANERLLVGASLSHTSDANWVLFVDQQDATRRAHLQYRTAEHSARAWSYVRLRQGLAVEAGCSLTSSHSGLHWQSRWRTPLELPAIIQYEHDSATIAAYLENHIQLTPRLEAGLGTRTDYSTLSGEKVLSARVNVVFHCTQQSRVFAAYGDFYQFPSLLSTISRNEPVIIADVAPWLKAEKATHYIVGGEKEWPNVGVGKITGYYKSYSRLLVPRDRILYRACNCGEGYAAGLELSLDRPASPSFPLTCHVHYAATRSRYRRVGNTTWTPVAWERPHTFVTRVEANVTRGLVAGLGWNYASGRPQLKGGRTSGKFNRFAPYSRLDIKVSYSLCLPIRKQVSLYIEVFNVTNARNVYDITWDFHSPSGAGPGPTTVYMMPRLISLGCGTML